MSLEVKCDCGKTLEVADSLAGTRGSCPYCAAGVQYPAARPRTTRVVISMDGQEGDAAPGLADLDAASKRKAVRAILIIAVCLIGGVYLILVHPRLQRSGQLSESRGTIFSAMREAETLETSHSYLEAYNRFQAIVTRSDWYLREVDPRDEEVAAIRARAVERQEALRASDLLARSRPGGGETAGATRERGARPSLLELLAEHPGDIFFDLPSRISDPTSAAVAGLGLSAISTPEDVVALWREPEDRREVPDAPGIERWVYRKQHGFDLEIHMVEGSPLASTIQQIHVYPEFPGFVHGIKVRGSTAEIWKQRVGVPEKGSVRTVLRYRHPFMGYVRFDGSGIFVELKVSFQSRQ